LLMLFLMRGRPECQVIGTASLAVLIIVIGVSLKDNLIRGRFDISYGIYIYAFPLQQIVINRVTGNFWAGMAISAFHDHRRRPFLSPHRKALPETTPKRDGGVLRFVRLGGLIQAQTNFVLDQCQRARQCQWRWMRDSSARCELLCQSACKFGSDSLLMQFEGCLAL